MHVYVITHKPTGRTYVGKSNDPEKRWKEHLRLSRIGGADSSLIHRAIHKYGPEEFSFEVVFAYLTEEAALGMESTWIDVLQSNTRERGFNLDSGGMGGKKHSQETIEKMSVSARKRKRRPFSDEAKKNLSKARIGNKNAKGLKHSNETKKRMSESHRGRIMSEDTKKKMSEAAKKRWAIRKSLRNDD